VIHQHEIGAQALGLGDRLVARARPAHHADPANGAEQQLGGFQKVVVVVDQKDACDGVGSMGKE
jgi:hypothetical protein